MNLNLQITPTPALERAIAAELEEFKKFPELSIAELLAEAKKDEDEREPTSRP